MSEAIKLRASHPDFKKIDELQHSLLIAMNPQMFFGLEMDVMAAERLATIEMIKTDIEELLDEHQSIPAEHEAWINRLEEEMGNDTR